MKNFLFLLSFLSMVCFFVHCDSNQSGSSITKKEFTFIQPTINIDSLTTNYTDWWSYQYNLDLIGDYVTFDIDGNIIDKAAFLEQLSTGEYIPIELDVESENTQAFQLAKLSENVSESIRNTMSFTAETLLFYHKMEGQELPAFIWEDLDGNTITPKTFNDKIVLIKTWFIACVACIEEFPELNDLVEQYEENDKVQFISLALDEKNDLQKFLLKKPFSYQVIPNQSKFIQDEMNLNTFPTHILLKDGKIVRITNKASEIIEELESLTQHSMRN